MYMKAIFLAALFIFFMSGSHMAHGGVDSYMDNLARFEKEAASGDDMALYKYAEEIAWQGTNRKKALELYAKAAMAGNLYARVGEVSLALAGMKDESQEKEYCKKVFPELKELIDKLQKENSAQAAYNLWDVYANGLCVKKDEKKGEEYLKKAAEAGINKAEYLLAQNFLENAETAPKGIKLLEKAFGAGLPTAGIQLASCYFGGKGTEKSEKEAMKIVDQLMAASIPTVDAQLGYSFYRGQMDFPQDKELGLKLLRKSAGAGVAAAQEFLKKIEKDREKPSK